VLENKNCIVDQREVGTHTQSFHAALRASLREDPDIILVGEMRDLETISLALTAAETGHLVFATLHTNSCAETIDRIVDVFPSNQQQQVRTQLAGTIAAVVSQRLILTADGKGRIPAYEIMMGTTGIRSLIREGKTEQIPSLIQTGGSISMNTFDACLKKLLNEGKITQDEAYRHAFNKAAVAPQGSNASNAALKR
jgi:twitching motility protein PilT